MALSIVKRPQGYVLGALIADADHTAVPISNSGGEALFTAAGYTTGDIVYIYSNISAYNGYWYVVATAPSFKIREYATAANQAFIKTGTANVYTNSLTHGWNCVHLPIIYKLLSSIWPTNGADTARTISTFSNWNGYTYIVAAGDIKTTGTASSLEYVVLSGTSVDAVYQIIQWFSDTNFVINLAYSAANVLSSGTVKYYYYNYCAKIRIYAGIPAAHAWTAQKAYELIAEVKMIPDSTGIITLNIAEYIKKKIEVIKNNSLLGTLPNNIDAWCNFYLTYAESYDDSNMYTVSEFTDTYTDDSGTFEGYAVNAKLPFKTRSAGALSQYVSGVTATTRQKWLTAFTRPKLFIDKYFDVSYIKNTATAGDYIKRDCYRLTAGNYSLLSSTNDVQTDYDQGVYRYAITQSAALEDRIDITYFNVSGVQLSETLTIDVNQDCTAQDFYVAWLNYLGGYDYWNFMARKRYSIDVTESKTQEQNIFTDYPGSYGEFADSIIKQTVRKGKNQVIVNSQFLTSDQQDAIKLLMVSPLVQICTSQYDRRTLLVDPNTLQVRRDQDDNKKMTFGVTYTDELPSQSL